MLKIKKITVKRLKITVVVPAIAISVANCSSTPPANNTLIDRNDPKYSTIYDVFSRYDTNSDNYLDRHEFSRFQLDPEIIAFRERIPEAARTIPLLFEEIDEDSDERISLDEITVIAEGNIPKIE